MPKILGDLASKLTAENISQAMYELNRNKADSNLSDLILDGDLDLHGGHNTILIKALNAGYGYRRWRRG